MPAEATEGSLAEHRPPTPVLIARAHVLAATVLIGVVAAAQLALLPRIRICALESVGFGASPGALLRAVLSCGSGSGAIVLVFGLAAAVFLITKMILKPEPEAAPAPTKDCPECRQTVPKDARRCMYCTQPV